MTDFRKQKEKNFTQNAIKTVELITYHRMLEMLKVYVSSKSNCKTYWNKNPLTFPSMQTLGVSQGLSCNSQEVWRIYLGNISLS